MEVAFLDARVAHSRTAPARNSFEYRVYYVDLPVDKDTTTLPHFFSLNRFNVWSIYTHDHGARDRSSWRDWFEGECRNAGVQISSTDTVRLIAHPRLFGYAFNPISFWILQNSKGDVRAILCEVNNTFGDSHNYLLAPPEGYITNDTKLYAKKNLYVSPFNRMEGDYEFVFDVRPEIFSAHITYLVDGSVSLSTWMGGVRRPLTGGVVLASLLRYPFMTFMVLYRIHFQALKLWWKGVPPTITSKPPPTSGKSTLGSTTPLKHDMRNIDVARSKSTSAEQ